MMTLASVSGEMVEPWPPPSWTWSLSGPPPDPRTAILRDVWIHKSGPAETLLLTVSDPDPARGIEHIARIPVDDHELRRKFEMVLSGCLGKRLADLRELRLD